MHVFIQSSVVLFIHSLIQIFLTVLSYQWKWNSPVAPYAKSIRNTGRENNSFPIEDLILKSIIIQKKTHGE